MSHCETCHRELVRGKTEALGRFQRRRYCGNACFEARGPQPDDPTPKEIARIAARFKAAKPAPTVPLGRAENYMPRVFSVSELPGIDVPQGR